MKKILIWIKGLFFFGNVQIQAAGDNAEQTQSVIENKPAKRERLLLLTLSQMRKVLEIASDDEKPKEQRMTEVLEIIRRQCIK